MKKKFRVIATSSPMGLSIIGRRMLSEKLEPSSVVVDLYTVKMTLNPETGQRYLSFAPLNPLASMQYMPFADFEALANRGVHCGIYEPADSIIEKYLEFVDNQDRVNHMNKIYLEECGPLQEYLDKVEHEATVCKKNSCVPNLKIVED